MNQSAQLPRMIRAARRERALVMVGAQPADPVMSG
jgi:hypothetical protein